LKRTVSSIALVALLGVAVSPAFAGSRGGSSGFRGGHVAGTSRSGFHRGVSVQQKSVFPQPVDPWKSWGVKQHHGFRDHSFTPFVGVPGFVGGTSVVVTAPPLTQIVEASPVIYAAPPMAAAVAPVALPAPATLPMTTLIDHPNGWYQLRGDGATNPYRWVWIPKPPGEPEPSATGGDAPAKPAEAQARDNRGAAYHWTDDRGVTTWTNKLERVPKRFRDQAAATAKSD
jgi:hypothetical protein